MAHAPEASSPALRFDVIAGLTAAAVVLPKAMAYATVAGLPVSVGLYTAFIPMIVYALLGTSRVLSVSSTTTLAILAGTELGLVVPDGDPGKLMTATATLTALTGALLVGASILRIGFVANFISTPVLTGFKAGIGMVIVLDQVPKLLGIHITKEGFFRDILSVAHHVPETSLITLAIAVVAAAGIAGNGANDSPLARTAGRGGRGDCHIMVVRPERSGGGDGGSDSAIAALDHASEPWLGRAAVARSPRHRFDELY
jgi:MFS superfamily sulfate permease-like transporter